MKTISVFNFKGGVGKTVSTINIASILAEKGFKVLLIDMDSQSSLSSVFNAVDVSKPCIGELLLKESLPLENVIVHTSTENIDIIPCNEEYADSEDLIVIKSYKEEMYDRLRKVIDRIKKSDYNYDYCIIDCPPADGVSSKNALVASDEVIIPVNAGKFGCEGIGKLLNRIDAVQKKDNPSLIFKTCFMTMVENRTNVKNIVKKELEDILGDKLSECCIRKNVALEEAVFFNMSVTNYQANSNASKDYKALVKELFNV